MAYKYKPDDLFFDLEVRGNIFVLTQYYPVQNKLIISLLEDMPATKDQEVTQVKSKPKETAIQETPINNDGVIVQKITEPIIYVKPKNSKHIVKKEVSVTKDTSSEYHGLSLDYSLDPDNFYSRPNNDAYEQIKQTIKHIVKPFKDTKIIIEDLHQIDNLKTFINRYGIAKLYHGYPSGWLTKKDNNHPEYVRRNTDPIYDPDKDGLRIGYNNLNYDNIMVAQLVGNMAYTQYFATRKKIEATGNTDLIKKLEYKWIYDPTANRNKQLTAHRLMLFNKKMFNESKYMSDALTRNSLGFHTNRVYGNTNRFVDISKLNSLHISLKRLALSLGLNIMESSTNRDPEKDVENLADLCELIAYNANDVYVTQKVFENGTYQAAFEQNNMLLSMYPHLIFEQQDKDKRQHLLETKIEEPENYRYIRYNRQTVNSTSRTFIQNVIAPYDGTEIKDDPVIRLTYPDAQMLKLNHDNGTPMLKRPGNKQDPGEVTEPVQVLDYIGDLLQPQIKGFIKRKMPDKARQLKQEYQKIREFYEQYEGKNVNETIDTKENPFWNRNQAKIKSILVQYVTPDYDTNDKLFHDQHGQALASYVKLSIGGIHGVEIKQAPYNTQYQDYQRNLKAMAYLKKQFNVETNHDLAGCLVQHRQTKFEFEGHTYKYAFFLNSKSTKESYDLKKSLFQEPDILDSKGKVKSAYAYTATGLANHQDFSSYYPTLMSNMAIFRNADGKDLYRQIYYQRLKYKKLSKDQNLPEAKRKHYALLQKCMKLLLNSASGGADATFSDKIKIRCNNKAMAMRIIGQLFAWYIGQCLAYCGGRVPSTNTDGLYVSNVDADINNQVVNNATQQLMLRIDPEIIDDFISKDSNNRIEYKDHKLANAKGGMLTSWGGPSTTNNLDHSAITDYLLAQYLVKYPDATYRKYNKAFAQQLLTDFLASDRSNAEKLRYLQVPIVGNPKTWSYPYLHDKESNQDKLLNQTNRILPVKQSNFVLRSAAVSKPLKPATIKKRIEESQIKPKTLGDIIGSTIDQEAMNILIKNTSQSQVYQELIQRPYNPKATVTKEKPRDIVNEKIKKVPRDQQVTLINFDLNDITNEQYQAYIKNLDQDFYLNNLGTNVAKWSNLAEKEVFTEPVNN